MSLLNPVTTTVKLVDNRTRLLAPSGTFNDTTGNFTLGTALLFVPNGVTPGGGNCYMYLPAGAGGLAGAQYYEVNFTSTTVGQIVGAPTTTATAWTGAVGIITSNTIVVPANSIGPNGRVTVEILYRNNNSGTAKSIRGGVGGATATGWFVSQSLTTTGGRLLPLVQAKGALNRQIGGLDSAQINIGSIPNYFSVDTSSPWNLNISVQSAAVTDWVLIESVVTTCEYA